MLFSWKPREKTPEPDPSVEDSAAALPSPSRTETCVVPVSGASVALSAVPGDERAHERGGERLLPGRLRAVDLGEPTGDDRSHPATAAGT